ncbi:tetraspanin-13-like [Penaeus chinensis]|uniref:tetraspanin-13-like n=1 Tax=Penaeus chinensis TaxID=139456 RepID=UPI001FB793CE|nr:tetraspanin-13-like [Penaeus chinensis]
MCGGFTCSKNSLLALNILYVIVAFILFGVAAAANAASIVTSLSLVTGIIVCGVCLLIISIVGLIGASKHHQVLLFFYMIVLFIIFIIQFSVACASLAINEQQQQAFAKKGWEYSNNSTKHDAQQFFGCCGFEKYSKNITTEMDHPTCTDIKNKDGKYCCGDPASADDATCCRSENSTSCMCDPCMEPIQESMVKGQNLVGGIGLFFSFTEIIGFLIAKQYRHQVDPRANIQSLLR